MYLMYSHIILGKVVICEYIKCRYIIAQKPPFQYAFGLLCIYIFLLICVMTNVDDGMVYVKVINSKMNEVVVHTNRLDISEYIYWLFSYNIWVLDGLAFEGFIPVSDTLFYKKIN